jgi:hypothetical protein
MIAGQPPPLPVRPRPRRGETADSYLRRLADANHLRFTHLRRYLARPEGSYDPIDPGRLAALAGRELPAILPALPDLAPSPRPPVRRYTEEEVQRNHAAKREKYAAIRRDAGNGMSERAIERKKIHREPAAPDGLHDHIEAMITADPEIAIAAIWERLANEHGTTVAHPTLRTYVVSRRAAKRTRAATTCRAGINDKTTAGNATRPTWMADRRPAVSHSIRPGQLSHLTGPGCVSAHNGSSQK